MRPIYSTAVPTDHGEKSIAVYHCDVLDFDERIDILTTSAFINTYEPTPRTLFASLNDAGISVKKLAISPIIDLRKLCHIWLSEDICRNDIQRIGCIEMTTSRHQYWNAPQETEHALLRALKAYFQMLDIAATYGISMETIALPLLGSGNQNISAALLMIPIINECIAALKRNTAIRRICFIERNEGKAAQIHQALQSSYALIQKTDAPGKKTNHIYAFISYSFEDQSIADMLCAKLKHEGIRVWCAKQSLCIGDEYINEIVEAIQNVSHFIVIMSKNSSESKHVHNEVALAFGQYRQRKISIKPLRIDNTPLHPIFQYYFATLNWSDSVDAPLESHLDNVVHDILSEL